jgi:hypothetical protein
MEYLKQPFMFRLLISSVKCLIRNLNTVTETRIGLLANLEIEKI